MKWGTRYSADYVHKLLGMVKRNLKRPFHFVCITDDAARLPENIEVLPIPELNLPAGCIDRGWRKLFSFGPTLDHLNGLALFLDLDIVIVDNIDAFFDYPGDFCIIRDWQHANRITGNSSVYRYEIGKHRYILDYFENNTSAVCANHRTEQAYLTDIVAKNGTVTYWPEQWCASFKRHCMISGPFGFFKTPNIPSDAKIIVFHGHPKPEEAIAGVSGKLFRGLKPTPWIQEHWRA